MKIGVVSEFYYPLVGGVSEHIRSVALELRKLGHEVVILTSHIKGEQLESGTRVLRLGRSVPVRYNNSLSRISLGWGLGRQMKETLDRENFDLLHLHSPLQPTLTLLALKHASCPILATFHSYYPRDMLVEVFQGPLRRMLEKVQIRVPVSEAALKAVAPIFPGDYRIVPNGVDYELFSSPSGAQDGQKRSFPGLASNRLRILFVGAMVRRKGLPHLIKAFESLCQRHGEVDLIVVGDGPEKRGILKDIPSDLCERIHFMGPVVNRVKLAEYYASADLFCAPSLGRESFGMVLLEAMAAGLPVIAYDIEGYRDVVGHGQDGLLVEKGNTEALASALEYFLENPDERERYGALGRQKARDLSWGEIARRLDRLYHELLGLPVPETEKETGAPVAVGAGPA